jgi:signal peptidase II
MFQMLKPISKTLQATLITCLLLSTVACDQASKSWARSALNQSARQALGGHVQLILAENRGGFLSLGDQIHPVLREVLFTGGVALALVCGVVWLFARSHTLARAVSVSLILGGGFGNVVDRIVRFGAVTDFIFVNCGPLRTGIFNLADVFVTTGVAALLIAGMFKPGES